MPTQSKKRKVRRTATSTFQSVADTGAADQSRPDSELDLTAEAERRPRRRLDRVAQTHEGSGVRVTPGQLPIFERGYLIRELKQIGVISAALFALTILLAIVLR